MYFSKKVGLTQCTMGSGAKPPEAGGIFKNFCVKSNLTVCKVTFKCKLQKKLGEQDVLVAPEIILLGEQLLPLLARFPHVWSDL